MAEMMPDPVRDATAITVPVPAKVNLSLHVVGQRGDGYHLLDSLVTFTETAYDRLTVTFGAGAAEPALTVSGPFADALPAGRDNAVMAAARAVGGITALHLDKGLPVASGLGGGAADAAALLRAAITAGRLSEADAFTLAAPLGADVPVCLLGRACRMEGIGEVLTPLAMVALPAILVNPRVPVETRAVFSRLATKENAGFRAAHPLTSLDGAVATIAATRNDLMPPAVAEAPAIGRVVEAIAAEPGCRAARMSGSGASVFGVFADDNSAAAAAAALKARHGWWTSATRFAAAA